MIEIPYQQLSKESLQGVIEEFIQREGTDYGEVEFSLNDKVAQVTALLKSGQSLLIFDTQTESTTIMDKHEFALLKQHYTEFSDED